MADCGNKNNVVVQVPTIPSFGVFIQDSSVHAFTPIMYINSS